MSRLWIRKEIARDVSISPCSSIMNQFNLLPNSCLMFSFQASCLCRIGRQLDLTHISQRLFGRIVGSFVVRFAGVKENQGVARTTIKGLHQTTRLRRGILLSSSPSQTQWKKVLDFRIFVIIDVISVKWTSPTPYKWESI